LLSLKTCKGKSKKARDRVRSRTLPFFIVLAFVAIFLAYVMVPTQVTQTQKGPPKAAVVDQLGLHFPNREFMQAAEGIMQEAGFGVDVYDPERVTVELYKALPTYGYGVVVFRVHIALPNASIQTDQRDAALFTSQRYNEVNYPLEQLGLSVQRGWISWLPNEAFFVVTPKFITEGSMSDYPSSVVILMGCNGVENEALPKSFVDRGASVVIGWSGFVSTRHTDEATLILLKMMLLEKMSIGRSVRATMNQVGADPDYGSVLGYYPDDKGNATISQLLKSHHAESELVMWMKVFAADNTSARPARSTPPCR